MTYLQPCFNCQADKASCARRAEVLKGMKGLGITSAKFACVDRQSKFRPGQRVEFDWRYYDEEWRGEAYIATFNGTIMREMPGNRRFSIRVDQEGEHYDLLPRDILKNPEFTSVRPADIRALDEADKPMCPLCRAYDDASDMAAKCYGHGDLSDVSGTGCFRATPPGELPDGVFERAGELMFTCLSCDQSSPLLVDLTKYDPEMAYCGGSPRCIP